MSVSRNNKVKLTSLQISFLMEHQRILPDLKEIVAELEPGTDEYLQGAHDALNYLLSFLEEKGGK